MAPQHHATATKLINGDSTASHRVCQNIPRAAPHDPSLVTTFATQFPEIERLIVKRGNGLLLGSQGCSARRYVLRNISDVRSRTRNSIRFDGALLASALVDDFISHLF